MNASFLVSVCGIKRKKFTSVPMKEVDINFHFHEQYLMSQDKTSYNLRVEGEWARDEILDCFPFSLNICSVKRKKPKKKPFWNGRNETIHKSQGEGRGLRKLFLLVASVIK